MLPDASTYAAPLLMLAAGGVFLVGGRFVRQPFLWGPACLLVLLAAGMLLSWLPDGSVALARHTRAGLLGIDVLLTLVLLQQQPHRAAAERLGSLLLSSAGVMLVAGAEDLVVLFVGLELAWFPVLLLLIEYDDDREASRRFGWLGVLSGLLVLSGFVLLYGMTGRVDLAGRSPEHPASGGSAVALAASVLILAGLGVRLPSVPFQLGSAGTLDRAPWGTVASAAILMKTAAALALVRLVAGTPMNQQGAGQLLLLVLSGLTLVGGGIAAATHTSLRGVLRGIDMSYGGLVVGGSAVALWETAHPGQHLAGGRGLPGGTIAALWVLGGYVLLSCGVFAVLAYLASEERPIEDIDDLAGLVRTEPAAALCVTVLLLGLAGLPLLPGFWGRLWIFAGALGTLGDTSTGNLQPVPHRGFLALAIAVAVSSLLVAAACLRILGVVLFEGPRAHPRPSGGQSALASALLASSIAIGIGLVPGPLLDALRSIEPSGSAVEER